MDDLGCVSLVGYEVWRCLRQGNNKIGRGGYLGTGLMDSKERRLIAECMDG